MKNAAQYSAPSTICTRRELLLRGGAGFGALALSYLLRDNPLFAGAAHNPVAPRAPHFAPRAKSVIFLFMEGGPSHIDLFDPKPLVNRLAGQPLPSSFRPVITPMGEFYSPLLPCRRRWARHGQCGTPVSDWLPHTAQCVDDIAVIRSCWGDGLNHSNGVCQMNTGSILAGRPSLGSWVTYGLGTENENLPAFVVMQDNPAQVNNGPRNWGAGFMPAVYQGVRFQAGGEPIPNLRPPTGVSGPQQQGRLDLLYQLNQQHAMERPLQTELDARIASYELAFRMQAHAPEAVDLSQETAETQALYGMHERETESYGRLCLLARRLVERGVRFVQLYHGAGSKWDAHRNIERNHSDNCRASDRPVAGLLRDLKRRGLLDETLVIWGGEFGRTPMSEQGDGRDHNPYGFTMWMAGGGVRGGQVIGNTDEAGLHAVEDRLHVHDLHATILYLLGLDHMRLIYRHQGRPERPTLNEGEAYRRITGRLTMHTGADLLVHELYRHGVRVIFGMPGSHTTAIYDAIERHGGIRTILIRNEQAGAFAADGYARVTGQPGVICTTAGPGATNALTGIAEAWADSIPVLLVTGQVNHDRLHEECGNYHEIDLEGIVRPCTKYAATVMDNRQIPAVVAQAFRAMTTGRPRPAALILPQDLMALPAPKCTDEPAGADPRAALTASCRAADAELDRGASLLAHAQRPILLAGGGALGASAEVRALAKRLRCPVITTLNGKGLLDERDPLSLGHARSVRARFVQPHVDVMLAIGCRFTEVMTGFRKMQVPDRLIQIDIDARQIGMNHPAEVGIVADAKEALRAILDRLPATVQSDWGELLSQARQASRPTREWFIDTLRAELPEDAVVFTDASEMAYRMHTDFPAYAPRSFFYPSNYIALGWGFPAAVGAAVAQPGRVVVSMSGDGGFVMTCQELATAARYSLRLIAIVHNDSAYGAIKHMQRHKHEERYLDTDLNNPNFIQLAAAYGVPGVQARNEEEFAAALWEAMRRGGPGLIEVPDQWRNLRE